MLPRLAYFLALWPLFLKCHLFSNLYLVFLRILSQVLFPSYFTYYPWVIFSSSTASISFHKIKSQAHAHRKVCCLPSIYSNSWELLHMMLLTHQGPKPESLIFNKQTCPSSCNSNLLEWYYHSFYCSRKKFTNCFLLLLPCCLTYIQSITVH